MTGGGWVTRDERVSGGREAGSEWVGECGQERMNAYMNE